MADKVSQQPQDTPTSTTTTTNVDLDTPTPATETATPQSEEPPKTKDMKICLSNLPKFIHANAVRKYVAELLKMPPALVSCKKAPKWDHAIVACKTDTPMGEILERLNGHVWNKHQLAAWVDHLVPKPGPKAGLKPKAGVEKRSLNDQVTPLWRVPYEEQLARKQAAMAEVVQQIELKAEGFGGLAPIKPSPQQLGYRNKCEFSIGLDREGQATVGFSLGGFREGTVTVANAAECLHVPASMKALASAFQAHIRSRGETAPVLDRVTKTGFWRLLMVRSHGDQLMVVVQVQKGFMSEEAAKAEIGLAKEQLFASFSAANDDGTLMRVGSFSVQSTAAVFHGMDPKAPYELVLGAATLTETLSGLRFQISPSSFFQVNPPATVVLYDAIRGYVVDALGKDVVLLDLCCGTGTIGMLMAQHVRQVYGVELVADAVEDARTNARLNGIGNIEFVCGRVEDVLPAVIAQIDPAAPIAVVLDPPRSGVRTDFSFRVFTHHHHPFPRQERPQDDPQLHAHLPAGLCQLQPGGLPAQLRGALQAGCAGHLWGADAPRGCRPRRHVPPDGALRARPPLPAHLRLWWIESHKHVSLLYIVNSTYSSIRPVNPINPIIIIIAARWRERASWPWQPRARAQSASAPHGPSPRRAPPRRA